jgi:hypothetical protein
MAYRITVFLALLVIISCGDDGGGKTKMDAPAGTDDSNDSGAIDAAVDAPPNMPDAGVGAVCGMTTCTPTQECCLGGGSGATCVTQNTCSGVAFGCDGPEDCGSTEVCCYGSQGSGSAGTGGSECQAATSCQSNACHVDMDCSGQTSKCCTIGSTQYKVCLAQCPPM